MKSQHMLPRPAFQRITIFLLPALLIAFAAFVPANFLPPIHYKITEQSSLYLEGTTNVNRFTCASVQAFSPATIEMTPMGDGCSVSFAHAVMNLHITSMDCGSKGINKDMQQALRADTHPDIRLQLERALVSSPQAVIDSNGWTPVTASTLITIAGVTKPVKIRLKAKSTGHNRYQFVGSRELQMSDFGVDPPKALMGLIQVNDVITIHFDLTVESGQ